jgi:hypothetical protein
MIKLFLLFLAISFLTVGCGQRNTIKNDVKSQRLADAYGDGRYMKRNLTFPLSDSALAYQTPLPGIGPIAGGILKLVGDIFAKNTNMGKLQMSYTQTLPEIPEELHSVRLSRVFFYMRPQGKARRIRDWFSRIFMGKGHVTFDFLDKFAVRMTTTNVDDPDNYVSTLVTKDYDKYDVASLMEVFYKRNRPVIVDTERAKEIVLLKYDGREKASDTTFEKYGQIHILETTAPDKLKHFFMDQYKMRGLYKRILILENSVLVELVKDPVANEFFKEVMSEISDENEKKLGITYIDTCTPRSCLELNIPDVNLMPIALKGNAITLDAIIHAGKVPESFNLKGFVEFEVQIDSPI